MLKESWKKILLGALLLTGLTMLLGQLRQKSRLAARYA